MKQEQRYTAAVDTSSSLLADWGAGMSAGCTAGPVVRWRGVQTSIGWPHSALRYH